MYRGRRNVCDLSFPLRSRYTTGQQYNLFDIDIFYRKSSLDELRVEPMESTPAKEKYKYTLVHVSQQCFQQSQLEESKRTIVTEMKEFQLSNHGPRRPRQKETNFLIRSA